MPTGVQAGSTDSYEIAKVPNEFTVVAAIGSRSSLKCAAEGESSSECHRPHPVGQQWLPIASEEFRLFHVKHGLGDGNGEALTLATDGSTARQQGQSTKTVRLQETRMAASEETA